MEDVDGEAAALAQGRIALALVIDADEHQRRLERHRGEGAGREARRSVVGIAGGHQRHPGREVTEDKAKFVRADHCSYIARAPDECNNSGRALRCRCGRAPVLYSDGVWSASRRSWKPSVPSKTPKP